MKKTGPSLDWCVGRLGDKENWWVDSISDKENWDVDDLSIIDPKQFLHISELLDSMNEFGLDSQFVDEAFFTFEILEEPLRQMPNIPNQKNSQKFRNKNVEPFDNMKPIQIYERVAEHESKKLKILNSKSLINRRSLLRDKRKFDFNA